MFGVGSLPPNFISLQLLYTGWSTYNEKYLKKYVHRMKKKFYQKYYA